MAKVISYIAVSSNGKISRKDGQVDWLESVPNPEGLDYGYKEFYSGIGTTVQGNATYSQILDWGIEFPYSEKENFVFSRQADLTDDENVQFVTKDHFEVMQELKNKADQDIWLIGGGQLNAWFLEHGLLDEIRVFIMPIIIPDGRDLFQGLIKDHVLRLESVKHFSTGVVELRYGVMNASVTGD